MRKYIGALWYSAEWLRDVLVRWLERRRAVRRRLSAQQLRRRRELWIIGASLVAVVALTYLEAIIGEVHSSLPIADNAIVFALINVNLILLLLLIYLVVRNLVKLIFEWRHRVMGARIRTKLVAAFVLLSLVPTLLLFLVSVKFITASIDNWFSPQVEGSLKSSLDVAQAFYRERTQSARTIARQLAQEIEKQELLANGEYRALYGLIAQWRETRELGTVTLFSPELKEIAQSRASRLEGALLPSPAFGLLRDGFAGREAGLVEPFGASDLVRGTARVRAPGAEKEGKEQKDLRDKKGEKAEKDEQKVLGLVVVTNYVSRGLVAKMENISQAFQRYKQQKILKQPLKAGYLVALLLVTLLIIFSATWFGFYLARDITGPIKVLAEGTMEVARGNLDYRVEVQTTDEVALLVDSFNSMTSDLKRNKQEIEAANRDLRLSNQELEARRRYMEIVLNNVAAGVVSVDARGLITTINRSAERILFLDGRRALNVRYTELLPPEMVEVVDGLVKELRREGQGSLERQLEVKINDIPMTLMIHLSWLTEEEGRNLGLVAVFDDVTNIVKAQRMEAWREVARRIAHEIKNPLTPIKLSAQRLRRRYLQQFDGEGAVFDECTRTIITQVDQLRVLVDEFSHFARLPSAHPTPHDLNDLVAEVLVLYTEGHPQVAFDFRRNSELPVFNLDGEQMRRVLINLLDNAVDAVTNGGRIDIAVHYDAALRMASLEVADDGCGVAPEYLDRIFEPYFSTKKAGTGLGLAIVHQIVQDHQGFVRVRRARPQGTRFIIELPMKT